MSGSSAHYCGRLEHSAAIHGVRRVDPAFIPAILACLPVTEDLGYEVQMPIAHLAPLFNALLKVLTDLVHASWRYARR